MVLLLHIYLYMEYLRFDMRKTGFSGQIIFSGILFSLLFSPVLKAAQLHKGYLDSVAEERRARTVELVIVEKPVDKDPPLKELIFDAELKSEFERRYTQEFGHTGIERNVEAPNRYDEFTYDNGTVVTEEEDTFRKQRFGEFMVRRLTEHHVDQYIQTNPSTRQVYELKETVSKVKLEVKKGYSFKINYSYSGNTFAFELKNPVDLENQLLLIMDPDAVGPSTVEETLINLAYPVTRRVKLRTQYKFNDGIVDIIGERPIRPGMTASITGTTYTKEEGISTRQHRILFGLSWSN